MMTLRKLWIKIKNSDWYSKFALLGLLLGILVAIGVGIASAFLEVAGFSWVGAVNLLKTIFSLINIVALFLSSATYLGRLFDVFSKRISVLECAFTAVGFLLGGVAAFLLGHNNISNTIRYTDLFYPLGYAMLGVMQTSSFAGLLNRIARAASGLWEELKSTKLYQNISASISARISNYFPQNTPDNSPANPTINTADSDQVSQTPIPFGENFSIAMSILLGLAFSTTLFLMAKAALVSVIGITTFMTGGLALPAWVIGLIFVANVTGLFASGTDYLSKALCYAWTFSEDNGKTYSIVDTQKYRYRGRATGVMVGIFAAITISMMIAPQIVGPTLLALTLLMVTAQCLSTFGGIGSRIMTAGETIYNAPGDELDDMSTAKTTRLLNNQSAALSRFQKDTQLTNGYEPDHDDEHEIQPEGNSRSTISSGEEKSYSRTSSFLNFFCCDFGSRDEDKDTKEFSPPPSRLEKHT